MRIVFFQQLVYEWQAPMMFSAIAKSKGHITIMYIVSNPMLAAKYAIKADADLIVFASITSGNIEYVYECAKKIKKVCNIPIIVGGPHISLYHNQISMQDIDYLGIGEGELTFSALLDYLEKKIGIESIPGIVYVRNSQRVINEPKYIIDIDKLPVVDRDLYYRYFLLRKEKVRMFYSGRGCLYNCSYCCVPVLNRIDPTCPPIRKRSPINLINEIVEVKVKYGLKASFFQDDSFLQDKEWLLEFLPAYKEVIDKPFMCMARAADIDENTATMLAEYGCVGIGIGVETANEMIRAKVLNRFESNKKIKDAIRCLKKNGIKVTTFNMFGIPGETISNTKETVTLNQHLKVDSAWGVLFQPYVNTEYFCGNKNERIASNFYSELGYDCEEKQNVEIKQKIFPLIVKFPFLRRFCIERIPNFIAYLIFCFFSFSREIRIWRRSFFITLFTGLVNQVQYKKSSTKE
ncbi:MAG: B12-binding domain-containing radical SAM protein [Clostridiales bacterium]|nr:B12-binding domain-containing radical SAM protein [Clostridiales bacterium]